RQRPAGRGTQFLLPLAGGRGKRAEPHLSRHPLGLRQNRWHRTGPPRGRIRVQEHVTAAPPWTVNLVYLVVLVCLVHLVSFVQQNKRDRPNKPYNGLLTLADFFSILLSGTWRSRSDPNDRSGREESFPPCSRGS